MTGTTQLGGGFGFLVSDAEIMPVYDPTWQSAPELVRQQVYEFAARELLMMKRSSLMAGEDVRGGVLLPIHPLTRFARRVNIDYTKPPRGRRPYSPQGRANENNPPLLATGHKARAVQLFRTARVPGGIWGYWDRDPHTGRYWGEVLYKHRTGFQQKFYGPTRSGKAKRAGKKYDPKSGYGLVNLSRATGRMANIPSRDVIGLPAQWMARLRVKVQNKWRQVRPQAERFTRLDPAQRNRPTNPAFNPNRPPLRVPTTAEFVGIGVREIGESVARRVRGLLGGLFR